MPRKTIVQNPDLPFHFTGRMHNREKFPLPMSEVWDIFEHRLFYLSHVYQFKIYSFVLMPNHFHGIIQAPHGNQGEGVGNFMRELAKELNRRAKIENQIWGNRYYYSYLASTHYYLNCYKYVYQNPVRAGLCNTPDDYRFSTLHGLVGRSALVVPLVLDDTLFSDFQGTLKWLSQEAQGEHIESMRMGLKHKYFQLPRDKRTHRDNDLESLRI